MMTRFAKPGAALVVVLLLAGCCPEKREEAARPDPNLTTSASPLGAASTALPTPDSGGTDDATAPDSLAEATMRVGWRADSRAFAVGHGTSATIVPVDGSGAIPLGKGPESPAALTFSASGDMLAIVGDRGAVTLWNASNGTSVGELPRPDRDPDPIGPAANIAFSKDGAWVAAVSDRVRLWEVATRKYVCSADPNFVFYVGFPDDGTTFVGTGAGAFRRWDKTCKEVDNQMAATGGTFGSVLSPDTKWMAAAEEDGHALSVFTTTPFRRKGSGYVRSASCEDHVYPWAFSRDGTMLLATGNGRWFRSFRVGSLAVVGIWKAPAGDPAESLTPFDDGVHLIVRKPDGTTTVVDTRAGARTYALQTLGAKEFDTSPDSAWIVGAAGRKTMLWEASTGRLVRTFEAPSR